VREDRAVTTWQELVPGVGLVATDLDGTLLRRDITVSERTVTTLRRARDEGLPVVFVTGRPPRWMAPVAAATGHAGLAVGANGAVVLDLATRQVRESFPITPDALEETVALLRAEVPGIGFAVEWVSDAGEDDATHFAYEREFLPRYPMDRDPEPGDVREFSRGHRVVKLLARVEDGGHDADGLLDLAVSHVEHLVEVTHSNAADVLLEMSAAGVSKGVTLARVAAELGVAAPQVAACGDMPNDLPMLTWAGVGLGVASAHPRVLAAADAVIPDPDHDGVAQVVDAVLDARG
jgi:Cof subfamily protein (haloacid dehalogenase superfamily)